MEDAARPQGLSEVTAQQKPSPLPTQPERHNLRVVPGDQNTLATLTDQMDKVETINRALREKVQSEKMALLQEHDRKWTETQHKYARMIHEATMRLETERDLMLRNLSEEFQQRSYELDKIALRVLNT